MKVELDLPNYAKKTNFNNAIGVDTLKCAKKFELAILKSEIDELDIGKLEATPVGWSQPSDALKIMFLKRRNMMIV